MARSIRSTALETRTQRLKLAVRWKPYTVRIAPGVRLAYRRNATAGRWSVIAANGKGGSWLKVFADADDYENANGETVLDYWQAAVRARILARGESNTNAPGDKAPATVATALDDYEADLKTRDGDTGNAKRVRTHLPDWLRHTPVALLTADELKHWRDGLTKKISRASINRVCNALRAALNLAADVDKRVVTRPWAVGLKAITGASESRNVILPDTAIRRLIGEAYADSAEFGLFVESAAVTGARPIQLARLQVQDLQRNRIDPRLMMPSSKKGKGEKKIRRRPVPIRDNLAVRLQQAGRGRPKHAPLLIKPSGEPWAKSDHSRLFARVAERAGLDPDEVTIYALRHSNIARQLLGNVPIRVVAVNHDTSVAMIEKNYSEQIADHSDSVARPALFNLGEAVATDNVVPLGGAQVVTFTEFAPAQWQAIQAVRADWPAEIDWSAVRSELEQAGRDFWAMRARRRRRPPKAMRARLQRALKRLGELDQLVIDLGIDHTFIGLRRELENRLALYEAWGGRSFGGTRDAHRELLYLRVIQQWTGALQGELKFSRADEAASGPAVRYFSAVLTAVLGDEAPGPAGIAKIIDRERRWREEVRLYAERQKQFLECN